MLLSGNAVQYALKFIYKYQINVRNVKKEGEVKYGLSGL